ncbi:MAG: sensor histidine kinase, partial [Sphingobacterium sp.]
MSIKKYINAYKVGRIILCLSFCFVFNATLAQQVLNNLRLNYEKASNDDPERFFLAGKYVQGLFFNNQEQKADRILLENIKQATKLTDGAYAAYLYAIHAMNDRIREEISASAAHIEKAKEYAEKSKNLEIRGYVSYCEGWLLVRDNKEGEAVRSFLRGISYYDHASPSLSLNSRKSSIYKELTAIYSNWNELELQEKYGNLALSLAMEQKDPIAIFDAYMLMGHLNEQQHITEPSNKQSRDRAEKYYRQAILTYNENKDQIPFPSNLSYVANNLANLYFRYFPDSYEDQALYFASIAQKHGLA